MLKACIGLWSRKSKTMRERVKRSCLLTVKYNLAFVLYFCILYKLKLIFFLSSHSFQELAQLQSSHQALEQQFNQMKNKMSMEIQQAKKDYNVLQSDMDKVNWKFNHEYCFMRVMNISVWYIFFIILYPFWLS